MLRQLGRLAQTDNGGGVFRAPAPALFLVAADHKRRKPGSLADIKNPDTLGRMKFVTGKRQHVHPRVADINGDLAGHLDGIGVKNDPAFFNHPGDFFNGKNHAGLIVGPHEADEGGVLVQAVVQIVQIQPPLAIHRHEGNPIPLFGQGLICCRASLIFSATLPPKECMLEGLP